MAALLVAAAAALDRPARRPAGRVGSIDLGELYADAHGHDLAGVLTDPRWTQYDPATFVGQLAGGRPQPTPVTRSLPGVLTRPPRPAGR